MNLIKLQNQLPTQKRAILNLLTSILQKMPKKALQVLQKKAVDEFSDDIGFKNILAKLYYDLASYEEALKFVTDRNLKAKILLQAGKNEEAKAVLDEMKPQIKEEKAAYVHSRDKLCRV